MKHPLQISIPTPCHENWSAMTPEDKGRFCSSCQKKVHDFTKSSDREIAAILAKENNACGRFLNIQLDRDLVVPKEKSTAWIAASAAVVSVLGLGNDAVAQTPVTTLQQSRQNDEELLGEIVITRPAQTISGIVKDSEGLAIPGVNIIVKGGSSSAQTDIDGKYSIEATPGDTIEFSFLGLETVSIKINNSNKLNVCLLEDPSSITSGLIVTLEERTIFGRIFTSVGNLFRKENKSVRYKEIPAKE